MYNNDVEYIWETFYFQVTILTNITYIKLYTIINDLSCHIDLNNKEKKEKRQNVSFLK